MVGEPKKATTFVDPCGLSLAVLKTIFNDTCNVNKLFFQGLCWNVLCLERVQNAYLSINYLKLPVLCRVGDDPS